MITLNILYGRWYPTAFNFQKELTVIMACFRMQDNNFNVQIRYFKKYDVLKKSVYLKELFSTRYALIILSVDFLAIKMVTVISNKNFNNRLEY